MSKNIYLVIGAISSGKSTVSRTIIQMFTSEEKPVFVSSDDLKKRFYDVEVNETNGGYRASDELFYYYLEYLLDHNIDNLVIEFCPMRIGKIKPLMKLLKKYNVEFTSLLVSTENAEINIERNKKRMASNPNRYDIVSDDKVLKSYNKFMEYVPLFIDASKIAYLIDTTEGAKAAVKIDNTENTIGIIDSNLSKLGWIQRIIDRYIEKEQK